jgi:transcriptional regulator with GAF, ATPase, and Fis domain
MAVKECLWNCLPYREAMDMFHTALVSTAMRANSGVTAHAARALGLTYKTMHEHVRGLDAAHSEVQHERD